MRSGGRNGPCPCGSGEKYAWCCAGREAAAVRAGSSPGAALHRREDELAEKLGRYAARRFGRGWLCEAGEEYFDDPDFVLESSHAELLVPWALYHREVEGRPVSEWFLEEEGAKLSEGEREWLLAQRPVVLTVWEVLEAEEGVGVRVRR
jgi:hypothetical protein